MILRCVSIAPLATPVVPPVYCRKARSSGASCTDCSVREPPAASASRSQTGEGSLYGGTCFCTWRITKFSARPLRLSAPPIRSPMPVMTMLRTWLPGSACSSVRAKFSSTTIVCAPESRN